MVFNKGVNVPFNFYTLNSILNGIERNAFTVIDLSFEDPAAGSTYDGFALYVNALQNEIQGTTYSIPLSKVKFSTSGTEVVDVVYLSDTSLIEAELSVVERPICSWKTSEGTPRNDKVSITYYIEPLMGYESDHYFVEINFTLRAYNGTP